MTLPANKLSNIRRRVARARRFPKNTCPASRHLHMMADMLANPRKPRANIEEAWEPEHIALTMYSVLESLWKARTKLSSPAPSDR